jgi:hypothetical protein
MNFLPVINDMQTLELAYTSDPSLSKQYLSFSECADISLGLIETHERRAVLTAQPSFLKLENSIITLQTVKPSRLTNGKVVMQLEPLQYMNLHFERRCAVIDDLALMLPEDIPYYALVQHLVLGRLEYILTEMDIFYLQISAEITEAFANIMRLRGYRYRQGMLSKYLLMTHIMDVMP